MYSINNLDYHDNMVKLVYHYQVEMHMNMQHYRLKLNLLNHGSLHEDLLHTYLQLFGNNAHGINDGQCISLLGPGSLKRHLHSMSDLL